MKLWLAFAVGTSLWACISASALLELNNASFEDTLKKHENVLVEYYAPWCGYCKILRPELEKLADALVPQRERIAIAAYDCNNKENADRCTALKLRGYPSIFLYRNGADAGSRVVDASPQEIPDTVDRKAGDIAYFLASKLGIKNPMPKPPPACLELTSQNYENVLKDKYALVKFTSDRCPHCVRLQPVYDRLAEVFKGDDAVVAIANVDCVKEAALCEHYGIIQYPTIKFFDHSAASQDGVVYNNGRDLESLVTFVNNQCHLHRNPDGTLVAMYARDPSLDALVTDFMANKQDRQALIAKAEHVLANATETSRYYATFMRRVLEKGEDYPKQELTRLVDIVSKGGLDAKKLDGFTIRINILKVFTGDAEAYSSTGEADANINPDDIFHFDRDDL